jgi:hypothetical protein
MKGLLDLTDIDNGVAAGQPLGEAPPHRERQAPPILVRKQGAKAMVVEQYFGSVCDLG